jgi:hypothetical protein
MQEWIGKVGGGLLIWAFFEGAYGIQKGPKSLCTPVPLSTKRHGNRLLLGVKIIMAASERLVCFTLGLINHKTPDNHLSAVIQRFLSIIPVPTRQFLV